MTTLEGQVVRVELGPGVFLLETPDGKRFALHGGDEALLQDGLKVSVEGDVRQDGVGIGMTSQPVLKVSSYTVLD